MALTLATTSRDPWVLLDLDLGRVYRFTDSPLPLSVVDAEGRTHVYTPGLRPTELANQAGLSGDMAVEIEGYIETPWARLWAQGVSIDRASAMVRRWYDGTLLEDAEVYIRGKVTKPLWGDDTEPLSFGIARLRHESGTYPKPTMVINASTWPVDETTCDPAAIGAVYPLIMGRPLGTPAYLVEYSVGVLNPNQLLIAGHKVAAAVVQVRDVGSGQSWLADVSHKQDLLGRWCAMATFDLAKYAGTPRAEFDREYRVDWNQDYGGVVDLVGGSTKRAELRKIGDQISYLLRVWTDLDVDWGMFNSALAGLNAYQTDFCLEQPEVIWKWLQQYVFSLLPIEWTDTSSGGYPLIWHLDATREDSIGHVDASPGSAVRRIGGVQSSGGVIQNEFTLQYAPWNGDQGRPSAIVTVGSGLNELTGRIDTDGDVQPNMLCRISESIHGRRRGKVVTTAIVSGAGAATANLIASQAALRSALSRRALRIEGPCALLEKYRVQSIMRATETSVEIDDEVALVRRRVAKGDMIELTLLLLDPPAARTRVIAP